METISRAQYEYLSSFYMALSHYYLHKIPTNFGDWAQLLDGHQITKELQNHVSAWADDKSTQQFYLSTLLKERLNISIDE